MEKKIPHRMCGVESKNGHRPGINLAQCPFCLGEYSIVYLGRVTSLSELSDGSNQNLLVQTTDTHGFTGCVGGVDVRLEDSGSLERTCWGLLEA